MSDNKQLSAKLEALLFHKSEPLTIKYLAKELESGEEDIREASRELREKLDDRGITLIESGDKFSLGTQPKYSSLIERITKEELNKDIGKAGLETLAVVLYKGPVSRSSIDYIRGVNSQFILRHLLTRGLVEKEPDQRDGRSYLYRPSIAALSHLGVSRLEDLPDYAEVKAKLDSLENAANQEKPDDQSVA
jgi:segregation and condensation protein B